MIARSLDFFCSAADRRAADDLTRVKLSVAEVDGSDYVNANFIRSEVAGAGCRYISTQGGGVRVVAVVVVVIAHIGLNNGDAHRTR